MNEYEIVLEDRMHSLYLKISDLQQENKQLKEKLENYKTELEEYIVNEEKINNELLISKITSESDKEKLGIENNIYDDILDKIQKLKEKYKC